MNEWFVSPIEEQLRDDHGGSALKGYQQILIDRHSGLKRAMNRQCTSEQYTEYMAESNAIDCAMQVLERIWHEFH